MTPELAAARLGKLSASDAAVIMGGLNTDGLLKLVKRLAGERLHGDLGEEGFKSWQMERGSILESEALDWTEFEMNEPLARQQHIVHREIPTAAATPDGLTACRVPIECKCQLYHVWAGVKESVYLGKKGLDAVPSEHRWQLRWQCWCCGVYEGKYVAYHPKSGGIIIPYTISQSDFDLMRERVATVEGLIANWTGIISQ